MKIAVIGGGLLGRLIALDLFEKGQPVTLFEKGESSGSSSCGYVGLGMLSPWSELPHLPPDDGATFHLGISSLDLWPIILQKIGISSPYSTKGSLVVCRQGELQHLEQLKSYLPTSETWEVLSQQKISQYENEVSHNFTSGIYFPREGCLDTKNIFAALTHHFSKIKLPVYYNCGECRIEKNNTVVIPLFGDAPQKFDFVVDARGLGAKSPENSLRGVRGETLKVFAPQVNLNRLIRVIDSKFPLYIVPRGEQQYSLGATCIESENRGPITVRSTLEILSMARFVHEGFMESNILHTEVQWRPAYADNKPKIHQSAKFLSVNGLFRHGIMCAPALASLCCDFILGRKISFSKKELLCEN